VFCTIVLVYAIICRLTENVSESEIVIVMNFCRVKPAEIKVIDFGSACEEGRTVYSYIQVYKSI
jgi:hypothetical protein